MSAPTRDYLIIGAGPAGLQLGAHLEAAGRDYLVLEGGSGPGTFFATFPRHRTLISINKPHTGTDDAELNLRMDWNSLLPADGKAPLFTSYTERYFPSADLLPGYLADYAQASGVKVRYDTRISRVGRGEDGVFTLTTTTGEELRARRLIAATGVSRPNLPEFEGGAEVESYDSFDVDPAGFTDQRVLIVGKGNSAFETADALIEQAAVIHVAGRSSVKLAWRTHYVGHLRAVNNNFLDTYQLKSQNAVLDGTIRRIEREGDGYRVWFAFSRADEVVKDLYYDRVILCTGFRFDASIFADSARPELVIDDRFPRQSAAFETSVPGLYIAGTLTQQQDFKHGTNGFIHGFRYGVRALHRILEQRYHETGWPAAQVDATPAEITDAVLARVNRTSALWQQFGVLADVVAVDGEGPASYYEEAPVGYVRDGGLGTPEHAFVVTLEYGPDHDKVDPFDISVKRIAQDSPGEAHDAAYLHPVVRHYLGRDLSEPTAVHHVAENLENHWDRPDVHRTPLVEFVTRCLAEPAEEN